MRVKKGKPNRSWVETSIENLKYFIGADFVDQLEARLAVEGLTQKTFADKLGVTQGRVSQIFNNPGNLTLDTMVSWGHAVGMKTGVVLYGGSSEEAMKGPLSGEIFISCWKELGEPRAMFDISKNFTSATCSRVVWKDILHVEEEVKTASQGDAVFEKCLKVRKSAHVQEAFQKQYSKETACGLVS